jgi:hypothetical protein
MKKEMRRLNKIEEKFVKGNIEEREKSKKYNEYLLKYYNLMIDEGLEMNMLKQKFEFERMRKDVVEELTLNEEVVKELNRQLKEGVEIKNTKEEKNGKGL